MVLSGHLELSNIIKNVHEELRTKSKLLGVERAWKEHCSDTKNLEKYAEAMKELATHYWEASYDDISRISWVYRECENYFNVELVNIRAKEVAILNKINITVDNLFKENLKKKWKLLDVGSCYNPFQHISDFEVTAIDIAPALKTVFKCDFLEVQTGESLLKNSTDISQFPQNYYDIIVFSLFLEYLPCPIQRRECCEKAYKLLKTEGILVIITPDSNHIGSNAKYIKSWRFVLAKMGFSRIKYEKLKHIHCMVFRKVPVKEMLLRWVDIHKKEQSFDEIYIPQDFKKNSVLIMDSKNEKLTVEDVATLNEELPFCDHFD